MESQTPAPTLTVPPVPPPQQTDPPGAHRKKGAVEGSATWSLVDRIGLAICWTLGLLFCAIAVAIVLYLLVQGIKFLRPEMLWTPAAAGFNETETGGFSDALFGTMIVATLGIALALPAGGALPASVGASTQPP